MMAIDFNEKDRKMEVGRRIQVEREAKNLTRDELAIYIGVEYDTLYKWEKGKRIPTDNFKVLLSNELGVSVQALFFD